MTEQSEQFEAQQVQDIEGIDPAPQSYNIPTNLIVTLGISMGFMAMIFRTMSSAMPSFDKDDSDGDNPDEDSPKSKRLSAKKKKQSTRKSKLFNTSTSAGKSTSSKKKRKTHVSKQKIADLNSSIEEEKEAARLYRERAGRLLAGSEGNPDKKTINLYLHVAEEEEHHQKEFTKRKNQLLGIDDDIELDLSEHLKQ